jgi:hypothetical protein
VVIIMLRISIVVSTSEFFRVWNLPETVVLSYHIAALVHDTEVLPIFWKYAAYNG